VFLFVVMARYLWHSWAVHKSYTKRINTHKKKHSKETKNNENKETINQKIQETTKPQPQKQVKNAGIKQNPQKPKT
jgi:hypothetical protein